METPNDPDMSSILSSPEEKSDLPPFFPHIISSSLDERACVVVVFDVVFGCVDDD